LTLVIENPSRYEIDYASQLIRGVALFNKDKSGLKEAKALLMKYKEIPKAQQLLRRIETLDKG